MRLGISVTSSLSGPSTVPAEEGVAAALAKARAAAEGGLDHLTFGDAHSVGPRGRYLQGVPLLARATAHWPEGRPSGLLFLLPLWHPVLLAEQIGTLAALSGGRFIVQTGIGYGTKRFAAMGSSMATRGAVADEMITVVKALLAGETVSSERFGIQDAAIGPVPTNGIEWWIGSGPAPAALDRAAREGDAWYVGPGSTAAELEPMIASYREHCARYGTTPRVVLRRDLFVADDRRQAEAMKAELVAAGYRGMRPEVVLGDDVAGIVDALAPFAGLGVDDIVARTPNIEASAALRSVTLLGTVREQLLDL